MRYIAAALMLGTLAACDEDPARSLKIIARPPLPEAESQSLARSSRVPAWRAELCPPAEAARGQGSFSAQGACAFEQTEQVNCIALGDDFFIELSRPASHGATLRIFGNVERYAGPGNYTGSQLLISLRTNSEVFPWNAGGLSMTVGEAERFVRVEPATLHPGSVRGAETLQVAGTLWCRATPSRR